MERLTYPHKPIASIKALSRLLKIPVEDLLEVASISDSMYFKNKPKPGDKKGRITYTLHDRLKSIQSSIKTNIFDQVQKPSYLMGAISGRDYIKNIEVHVGARLVVSEDVTKFFDSIQEKYVEKVYLFFFGFSPDVSKLLTKLTTYKGFVAQGSVTSSDIANTLFFDVEPQVVHEINNLGFTYTRFVDDINASTKNVVSQEAIEKVIQLIIGMLSSKRLKANRRKHAIMDKSVPMRIHKRNINSGKGTLPKNPDGKIKIDRDTVKLAVFNLKKSAEANGKSGDSYKTQYNKAQGKVREYMKLHPKQGSVLLSSLSKLLPTK